MSEKIHITLITENEKRERKEINVTHDSGVTLMTTLLQHIISGNFCGGRGTCGRCRVRFLQAAPLPTSRDRQAFTPEELRRGYRLACMAKPGNDCIVQTDFIKSRELEIVTNSCDVMNVSERNDYSGQRKRAEKEAGKQFLAAVDLGTTTIAMQLMDMESGNIADTYCVMNPQRRYGADVLSRIQAANAEECADAGAGRNAGTGGAGAGAGKSTGESGASAAAIMRDSVWDVIQNGLDRFYEKIAERKEAVLCCMCIAGNTTMEHLLLGRSTQGLGKSPFTPEELGLQKRFFPAERNGRPSSVRNGHPSPDPDACLPDAQDGRLPVYVAPGFSAFVGGDIMAGLYRLKMLPLKRLAEEMEMEKGINAECRNSDCTDRNSQYNAADDCGALLLIDLGTNGEMAMTDGKRMVVTAAAAGPAFEGGPGKAAAGSDMVAMTAFLLKEGIIDETGLLAEPYFDEGVTVAVSGSRCSLRGPGGSGIMESPVPGGLTDLDNAWISIRLTQKDIRDLQMAKAAVRAGVEILHRKMDCPPVKGVWLAGGFGYYLDVEAAVAIGLLPEKWKDCTKAAGNTSLAGAFELGKDLWSGELREETLSEMMRGIESINLAKEPEFEELYIRYMELDRS